MLQYKIPQDVGIEDKIIGPLSLRQLIIVAVGVGISYVIYAVAAKLYELNTLEYIIIALPAMIAAAAAFIKVNNVSFTKFILLSLEYAIKPKKRLWDHRGISHLVAPDLKEKEMGAAAVVAGSNKRKDVNLDELSRILDSGGFENVKVPKHEDIDKVKDDDLMTEAYFGHKKSESQTENMYWRTKESQKKRLDILAKIPPVVKKEAQRTPDSSGEKPVIKEAVKTEQKPAPQPVPRESAEAQAKVGEAAPQPQASLTPQVALRSEGAIPQQGKQPQNKPVTPIIPPKIEKPAQVQPIQAKPQPEKTVTKPEIPKPQVQKPAQVQKPTPPVIQPQKTVTKPETAKLLIPKPAIPEVKKTPEFPPKKPQPAFQQKPSAPIPTVTSDQAVNTGKKKRRRNKKPKTLTPVRPETQINNTQKNKPVTLIPKEKTEVRRASDSSGEKPQVQKVQQEKQERKEQPAVKKDQPVQKDKPVPTDQTGGEIHLEELKKGEITWGF